MREERRVMDTSLRETVMGRAISAPVIDLEKCKGCRTCVLVCPAHVLELKEGKSSVAYADYCMNCEHCWAVCPTEAISIGQVKPMAEKELGVKPPVSPENLQLLLEERRSVRLYQQKPVAKETMEQVIEAGRYAPTGGNLRDVQYIVVGSVGGVHELRKLIEAFWDRLYKMIGNKIGAVMMSLMVNKKAVDMSKPYRETFYFVKKKDKRNAYVFLPYGSAIIVVHAEKWNIFASFDCAMALYNCTLKAHTLGLGSCFGGFIQYAANQDSKIRAYLNIPEGHQCYGALVLGYPDVTYRRRIERPKPNIQWR